MLTTPYRHYRYPDPLGYDMASPAHVQVFAQDVDADLTAMDPYWPFFKRRPTVQLKPTTDGNFLPPDFYHSMILNSLQYSNHPGLVYDVNGIITLDPALLAPSGWVAFNLQLFMSNSGANEPNSERQCGVKVEDWGGALGTATQVAFHIAQSYETTSAGGALQCTGVVRLQQGWRLQPLWLHSDANSPVRYLSTSRWTVTFLRQDST